MSIVNGPDKPQIRISIKCTKEIHSPCCFESFWISIPELSSKLLHYADTLFTQSVIILMRPNSGLMGSESEARIKVVGGAKAVGHGPNPPNG